MRAHRNGYADSIMSTVPGVCYVCKRRGDTARHEILYGTANRKNAKAAGLWINVCPECHARIHAGDFPEIKAIAQRAYEHEHSRAEFVSTFGKNYLED
jgi:hypothetical protein